MKKYLIFLIPVLMIHGCQPGPEERQDDPAILELNKEIAELKDRSAAKDSSMNEAMRFFNEIQENLDKIKEKEGIITTKTMNPVELPEDMKATVIEDIQLINGLLIENKQKVRLLREMLAKANIKVEGLEQMVTRLTQQIEEMDAEIVALKEELANLKISHKLLAMANMEQAELIAMQTEELNMAFYCFGSFKELRDEGVITKEGGFIGLGRNEKLRQDFNKSYFTRVDITETAEIDLLAKKAKIVTTHPQDSYELRGEGKVDKIVITKPAAFWSVSKYLVIITE